MQMKCKSIVAILLIMFIFITAVLGIVVLKRNQYLSVINSDALTPVSYELYFASLPQNHNEDAGFNEMCGIVSAFFVLYTVFVYIYTKKDFSEIKQNDIMKKMMVVLLQ